MFDQPKDYANPVTAVLSKHVNEQDQVQDDSRAIVHVDQSQLQVSSNHTSSASLNSHFMVTRSKNGISKPKAYMLTRELTTAK